MPGWDPLIKSRRDVLAIGAVSMVSVAGCSTLSPDSTSLDLTVFNHTDTSYTVEMSLYRVDRDLSRSGARAYSERIDIEPGGEARREEITHLEQYLIRYEVYENNRRLTDEDHAHYYPANGERDDWIAFDLHSPGVMTRR